MLLEPRDHCCPVRPVEHLAASAASFSPVDASYGLLQTTTSHPETHLAGGEGSSPLDLLLEADRGKIEESCLLSGR